MVEAEIGISGSKSNASGEYFFPHNKTIKSKVLTCFSDHPIDYQRSYFQQADY